MGLTDYVHTHIQEKVKPTSGLYVILWNYKTYCEILARFVFRKLYFLWELVKKWL